MNFQNAIAGTFVSPIPCTNAGSVDGMTSLLTETLLLDAADIASPMWRKKEPREWCATEAELKARLQDREDAMKRVRCAPNDRGLQRGLEGDHQTAETHVGGSCTEVLRKFR